MHVIKKWRPCVAAVNTLLRQENDSTPTSSPRVVRQTGAFSNLFRQASPLNAAWDDSGHINV